MSLIEQAAKRLEQLRKAGVEIPGSIAEHEQRLPADLRAAAPAQPQTAQVQAPDVLSATTASASAHTKQSRRIELDLNTLAATGLISPDAPRSQLADQYRVIKRPLIANAMGKSATPIKRGNLIMVTSAIAGEGKTFSAINLAMSIAMELDNTLGDAGRVAPSASSSAAPRNKARACHSSCEKKQLRT